MLAVFITSSALMIFWIASGGISDIGSISERRGFMAYFYIPFAIAMTPFIIIFWIIPAAKILMWKNVFSIDGDSIVLPTGERIKAGDILRVESRSIPRAGLVIHINDGYRILEIFAAKDKVKDIVREIGDRIHDVNYG